jgi:hypothetical protein
MTLFPFSFGIAPCAHILASQERRIERASQDALMETHSRLDGNFHGQRHRGGFGPGQADADSPVENQSWTTLKCTPHIPNLQL